MGWGHREDSLYGNWLQMAQQTNCIIRVKLVLADKEDNSGEKHCHAENEYRTWLPQMVSLQSVKINPLFFLLDQTAKRLFGHQQKRLELSIRSVLLRL